MVILRKIETDFYVVIYIQPHMPPSVRTTTELANLNLVKTLAKHKEISSDERAMLYEYAKRIKNGAVEIDYNYSKRVQLQQKTGEVVRAYGRLYAQRTA